MRDRANPPKNHGALQETVAQPENCAKLDVDIVLAYFSLVHKTDLPCAIPILQPLTEGPSSPISLMLCLCAYSHS